MTSRSPEAGARSMAAATGRRPAVAAGREPQQPGPGGAEAEDGDDRVVKPAHVGVAMKGLPVLAVAVLHQAESVELHVVAALQPAVGIGEGGVRQGAAGSPERPEATLLDPVVVAEQAARLPGHAFEQGAHQLVGAHQPAPGHVHPRHGVKFDALDRHAVDLPGSRTDRDRAAEGAPLQHAPPNDRRRWKAIRSTGRCAGGPR